MTVMATGYNQCAEMRCAALLSRANRFASEIAAAKKEGRGTGTVTQLQSYIMGNSYIKVFSLGDDMGEEHDEAV
jgi:hypothetical protein